MSSFVFHTETKRRNEKGHAYVREKVLPGQHRVLFPELDALAREGEESVARFIQLQQ